MLIDTSHIIDMKNTVEIYMRRDGTIETYVLDKYFNPLDFASFSSNEMEQAATDYLDKLLHGDDYQHGLDDDKKKYLYENYDRTSEENLENKSTNVACSIYQPDFLPAGVQFMNTKWFLIARKLGEVIEEKAIEMGFPEADDDD